MADPQVRAADVFVADFERRSGGPVRHRVRVLGAFVGSLFQGLVPLPAVHDVVVRRRDDGTEVLRVPAGDPTVPGDLLRLVQRQLEEHDVATFLAEWSPRAGTERRRGVR